MISQFNWHHRCFGAYRTTLPVKLPPKVLGLSFRLVFLAICNSCRLLSPQRFYLSSLYYPRFTNHFNYSFIPFLFLKSRQNWINFEFCFAAFIIRLIVGSPQQIKCIFSPLYRKLLWYFLNVLVPFIVCSRSEQRDNTTHNA